MTQPDLRRFAWLSIAAALATILLKTWAWWLTGSVGLLSDALESLVNLAGAPFAISGDEGGLGTEVYRVFSGELRNPFGP